MAPAPKSTSDTLRPSNSPIRKPDPARVTIAARMYGGINTGHRLDLRNRGRRDLLFRHGRKGDPAARAGGDDLVLDGRGHEAYEDVVDVAHTAGAELLRQVLEQTHVPSREVRSTRPQMRPPKDSPRCSRPPRTTRSHEEDVQHADTLPKRALASRFLQWKRSPRSETTWRHGRTASRSRLSSGLSSRTAQKNRRSNCERSL